MIASNSRLVVAHACTQKIIRRVEKTGEIVQFLLKAIDDIGPTDVLQIVTDNASNCKAAGKEIENVS